MPRLVRICVLCLVLITGPAGCGWLGAAHAPRSKPDTFVLRGRVTVPVGAGDTRPDGAACASTLPDVVSGAPVRVQAPDGNLLATGTLGDGVVSVAGATRTCDFPFQVTGVPGGVNSYDVAVGTQPPRRFPAKDLRENAAAVIAVAG